MATSTHSRELRLALGMRGGVSLAVWIGGACAELDHLRQASDTWASLIDLAGYDRVTVDVMAGASAGGLNGIMFSASQIYGFDLADFRDDWLDLANLRALVRTDDQAPLSLLAGDENFFTPLCERLTNHIDAARPLPERDVPTIDLTLTATMVEPVVRPIAGGGARRFDSVFRFRHRPLTPWASHFPPPDDPGFDAAVARLALAARATSSYPVAFEGARVHAPRPGGFGGSTQPGAGLAVSMAGVFADASERDMPFVVMDGGVLDNIPLGRALTAIGDAPADIPTDRVLVYVQPGGLTEMTHDPAAPEGTTPLPGPADERHSSWNVLEATIRTRLQSENISDDLIRLHEHNRRVARAGWLRSVTLTGMSSRADLRAHARDSQQLYRLQRADADAQAIRRLIEDPLVVLGEDPFPTLGGRVAQRRWLAPLAPWPDHAAEAVDAALARSAGDDLDPPLTTCLLVGVSAVARLADVLRDWLMALEHDLDGDRRAQVGQLKQRLYRLGQAHAELLERPRRLGWVAAAATDEPDDVWAWVDRARAVLDGLARVDPALADQVRRYVVDGDGDGLGQVRASQLARLDDADDLVDATGTDLRELLVGVVLDTANEVNAMSLPPALIAGGSSAALHAVLYDPGRPFERTDLEAIEVAFFDEAQLGAAGLCAIRFAELSAANPAPLAPIFAGLTGDPTGEHPPFNGDFTRPHDDIHLDHKLAGNELNNFAAFLRRSWRANDWMWGRLDTVPTAVGLLANGERLREAAERLRRASDATPDTVLHELVERVHDATVLGLDEWPAFLETRVWQPFAPLVERELAAIVDAAFADAALPPEPSQVQRALTLSRQLLIAARELPSDEAVPRLRSPDETLKAASRYTVGRETLTLPLDADDGGLLRRMVAVGRTVADASLTPRATAGVRKAVSGTTGFFAALWLEGRQRSARRLALVAAVALVLLVGLPAAFFDDEASAWWSGITGSLTVATLLAAIAAALLGRRVLAVFFALDAIALGIVTGVAGHNWLGLSTQLGLVVALALLVPAVLWWKRPKILRE